MNRTTRGKGRPIKTVEGPKPKAQCRCALDSLPPATCPPPAAPATAPPPATLTLSLPLDPNGAIPTPDLLATLLTLCHYASNDRALSAILSDALSLHTIRTDPTRPAHPNGGSR